MKKAKQILSLVLALLMVIGIPMSVSAADKLELVSVKAISDYRVELKFSEALRSDTPDLVNGTGNIEMGIAWIKDEIDSSNGWPGFGDPVTVGTRCTGTVVMGATADTLIWTIDSSFNTKASALAGAQNNGYTRKFYFFDAGNGWIPSSGYINAIQSADQTRCLVTPYARSANYEYLYADIEPLPAFEALSATALNDYEVELKFSRELRTVLSNNEPWQVDFFNRQQPASIGVALVSNERSAETGYYVVERSAEIKGTVRFGEDNKTLIWKAASSLKDLDTRWAKDGYSLKFYFFDNNNLTWFGDGNKGHIVTVQDYDGNALSIPAEYAITDAVKNEYMFLDFVPFETPDFVLESATAVNDYQIELKFSEALNENVLNNFNAAHGYLAGLVLVSNEKISNGYYERQNEFIVPATLTFGESNDTLLWTLSSFSSTYSISTIIEDWTKEGYTVKFGFKDNDCGNYGEGYLGAILSASGSALSIPDDFVRPGAGAYEYMFMDITRDSSFRLESASVINDHQIALKFSEELNVNTISWITGNALLAGIVEAADNYADGAEESLALDKVSKGTRYDGTFTWGESNDTLIWTINGENSINALLAETVDEGYTRRFYFYDNGNPWMAVGHIGTIQTADGSKALPAAYARGAGYEFMFADIESFVGVEQGEVIELQDKDYHFMNADTGRSLTVGGAEEFTIVRAAADSNLVMLKVGEQYVNLHTTPATLGNVAYQYLLEECEYDRYRLLVSADLALADSDEGTDNEASLGYTYAPLNNISGGWYLTASGEDRPLRILPIGDSITYGSNPDGFAHGWRDSLSADLTDKLDRVVFVGSQTSKVSTIDDATLYRHEGNPGWTVGHKGASLNDIATAVVDKYDPDVVLLMAGINDMDENQNDQQALSDLKTNYTALIEKLAANMEGDDVIFCSTLTPIGAETWLAEDARMVYAEFPAWVKEWAAKYPVVLNDNYAALVGTTDSWCSDNLHLGDAGDARVAAQYAKSIMNYYNTDGTEKNIQEKITAAAEDGLTEIYLNGDETIDRLENIPAGFTLDLNGYVLTADYVNVFGQIKDSAEGKGGIAIAKNVTGDQTHLLHLQTDNVMMPLYEDGFGYRFFTCTTTQLFNPGTARFGFQININETGLALLKEAANADVELLTKLIVTVDGDEKLEKDYVFQAATIADYATKKLNDSTSNWAIILTVTGFEKLTGENITMTSTPIFTSSTGVGVAPATDATVTYNHSK